MTTFEGWILCEGAWFLLILSRLVTAIIEKLEDK